MKVIKKAASKIEDKGEKYPETLATIKWKLRFSMLTQLRSTLRSLRGYRVPIKSPSLENFGFNL